MASKITSILFLPLVVHGYCPDPYIYLDSRCLYFQTIGEVSQPEARQLCHAVDGELASIVTPTQHKAIIDHISDTGMTGRSFWIDGTDEAEEGQWITSNGINIPMGTPFWEAHLNHQEPDNGGTTRNPENCLQITYNYEYFMDDQDCTSEDNSICETTPLLPSSSSTTTPPTTASGLSVEKTIECPNYYVDIGGKCLAFMTWVDESWELAKQACSDFDGELASIENVEVLRALYLYIHQEGLNGNSFWLGGSDDETEGLWKWLNGTEVPMGSPFWGMHNYSQGMNQEPNGGTSFNCLILLSEGAYYFRDANSKFDIANPLCQYNS